LSQGAKSGYRGVLLDVKITEEITAIRNIATDKCCVSLAFNPECITAKALLNFIVQLQQLSASKPIGFKLCIGDPVEFLNLYKRLTLVKKVSE
tara:strand:+ start:2252 stop:2530 length:279 start_codon:yes stop_codon:yes gene_type:complete